VPDGFGTGFSRWVDGTGERDHQLLSDDPDSGSSAREIVDFQQGDYEEMDQLAIAKPMCKAAFRVLSAEDIGIAVAHAIRAADSGRPGCVYLDLPAKLLGQTMEASVGKASLVEVIDPAPRQLPAPDDHPQSAGAARSLVLKEADVVVMLGARLNWLLSHGKGKAWGEGTSKRFIQVDIEPREMDSNVEMICRYELPVCVVIFSNNGIYRGTDTNPGADGLVAPTVLVKGSRYDKMMEAFGGVGAYATNRDELAEAVNAALDSGKPTLVNAVNAVIDETAGTESGRIGDLIPQSVMTRKKQS